MAQHGWVMKKKGKKSCDTLPIKNYLCSVQVHCVLYCICIKGSWQHQTKHRKLFDMIQYVPSTQCILIGRGPHLAGYIQYTLQYIIWEENMDREILHSHHIYESQEEIRPRLLLYYMSTYISLVNTVCTKGTHTISISIIFLLVKGTVSRDYQHFFGCLKYSTWAPYEQAKVANDYAVTLF